MSEPPANPRIYHITHVDNLSSILAAGGMESDAKRARLSKENTNIGMMEIKKRRLVLDVPCHPGAKVGEYVPFYFCPRSIMLYLIHMGNHPELGYTGGQKPIVHLEADLHAVIAWADSNRHPWVFTKSNAGAFYTLFYNQPDQLKEVNWEAVSAQDFRDPMIKEGKQAEFLLFDHCPWGLIQRVGVMDEGIKKQVKEIIGGNKHQPIVSVQSDWYY